MDNPAIQLKPKDSGQTLDHDSLLSRYRLLMIFIGVLYPSWRYVAYFYNPTANESWEQRGGIAVIFLTFSLMTFWSEYFRKHVARYFNVIVYLWFAQTFYLMEVNDMSFDYQLMGLIVIFTAGASFLDSNAMLWYYLMCIVMTGVTVVAKPDGVRMTFFFGVITALVVSYVSLRSLLKIFSKLDESRIALQKRTDEFTELSSAVQTLFLPRQNEVQNEHWHIAGFYRPVDGCGGDWWSYFEHKGKLTIVVGDVTGHGPGPAMMTASIASYTRALQNERPDLTLHDILHALNKYLLELQSGNEEKHHYLMTVQAAEIDLNARKFRSWSAGAPSVTIYDAHGAMRTVGENGSPLGLNANLKLGFTETDLNLGDRILLYTDGIMEIETGQGKRLSERSILKTAGSNRGLPPGKAVRSLIDWIDKMRGKGLQEDDYTLIVFDFLTAPPKLKLNGAGADVKASA